MSEYDEFLSIEKKHKETIAAADRVIHGLEGDNKRLTIALKSSKTSARETALQAAMQLFPKGRYENFAQRGLCGQDPENLLKDAEEIYQWLIKKDKP